MFLEEAHVTFYADIAAMVLTFGVIVLCSRGVITDRYEGRIFRNFLLSIFCLAAFNTVSAVVDEFTIMSASFVVASTILNNILLIFQIILVIAWVVYLDYKVFRSRDALIHIVYKRMIPLYALIVLVIVNMFTGILFYYDENGVYHEAWGIYIYSGVLAFYFFISVIQVAVHKKKYGEPKFFDIWSLLIPTVLGFVVSMLGDYYTIALGFALGMTNVYAGIINERSFQDQETGYYNRSYLQYLKKEVTEGSYRLKSGMIFHLGEKEDAEVFAKLLTPLLPKDCVMARLDPNTLIMLAEISERVALHMMKEDAEDALLQYNAGTDGPDIRVTIDMIMKKKETPVEFYESLLHRVKLS